MWAGCSSLSWTCLLICRSCSLLGSNLIEDDLRQHDLSLLCVCLILQQASLGLFTWQLGSSKSHSGNVQSLLKPRLGTRTLTTSTTPSRPKQVPDQPRVRAGEPDSTRVSHCEGAMGIGKRVIVDIFASNPLQIRNIW